MQKRLKIQTGQIFSLSEIVKAENISLNPQGDPDLSFLGYERFTETPKPTTVEAHIEPDGFELFEGEWRTKWRVTPFSPAEISALLAERKTQLIRKVDADVDQIMREAVGERVTEYQIAEAQAREFKARGYTGEPEKYIKDWAVLKSLTYTQSADNILAQADSLRAAQDSMRKHRLEAKEAMRVSPTDADLTTANNNWAGYVTLIRTTLGI